MTKNIGQAEFAKRYARIIEPGGKTRPFNKAELDQLKHMDQMNKKGYELSIVKTKKGTRIIWVKTNSK